jgi:hypothetical protein
MGIGHYGLKVTQKNGLNLESKNILNEIIDRFPLISVRCSGSYEYLKKSIGLPLIEDIKNETLYNFPFKNLINNQKKYKIPMDKFVSLILKKL